MKRVVYDIEANGLDDATTIHSLVLIDIDTGDVLSCADQPGYPSIEDGLRVLEAADLRVGHNAVSYDDPTLRRLRPSYKPRGKIRDTLLMSQLIYTDIESDDHRRKNFPKELIGRHSLEAWGHRLGKHKIKYEGGWETWTKTMQDYCVGDVHTGLAIWRHMEEFNYSETAVQLEHDFRYWINQMETFGFRFDLEWAGKFYGRLANGREMLRKRLEAVVPPKVTTRTLKTPAYYKVVEADYPHDPQFKTKSEATAWARAHVPGGLKRAVIEAGPPKTVTTTTPFNPGSRDQIAAFLLSKGWKPTSKTDSRKWSVDEDTLEDLDFPEGRLMSKYFLVKKRTGQIAEGAKSWLKNHKNGRIHPRLLTNGAVTGRCTHSGIANIPRVTSPFGRGMRRMFTADPGFVMVGADASGLELRMLAHFLSYYDGGEYIKVVCEGDVHTTNQKAFGLPPGKKARNDYAKPGIYCMVYGGGNEKLGATLVVLEDAHEKRAQQLTIPAWAIRSMAKKGPVTALRRANWRRGEYARRQIEKNITGFDKLIATVQRAIESRKGHRLGSHLTGVDGRLLRIRSAHAALNTLLQSAGALVVKLATVIACERLTAELGPFGGEWALLIHYHDEYQFQTRPHLADRVGRIAVESIAEAGRRLGIKTPLTGEFSVGNNWAETH